MHNRVSNQYSENR